MKIFFAQILKLKNEVVWVWKGILACCCLLFWILEADGLENFGELGYF